MNPRAFATVTLAAVATVSLATLFLYTRLPDPFPIHFDIHGRVDGFAPRALGAWLLPVISALIVVWARFVRAPAMALALLATSLFLAAMHALILRAAMTDMILGGGLVVLLGAFDVAMGLLFPRLRRNRFVGIRLPWTLSSDENWARAHRFGGAVFVVGGLVTLVAAVLPNEVAIPIALVTLIAMSVVVSVVSYRIAHPRGG